MAEYTLIGPVVALRRDAPASDGRVTVLGFVDGEPRKVYVDLAGDDYDTAVEAHRQRMTVRCFGTLTRTLTSFQLQDPRDFEMADVP